MTGANLCDAYHDAARRKSVYAQLGKLSAYFARPRLRRHSPDGHFWFTAFQRGYPIERVAGSKYFRVVARGTAGIRIPVKFNASQQADGEQFTRERDPGAGQCGFRYCAASMRGTAFVFRHRLCQGAGRATAELDLSKIWPPDGVWLEFVNAQLAKLDQAPL